MSSNSEEMGRLISDRNGEGSEVSLTLPYPLFDLSKPWSNDSYQERPISTKQDSHKENCCHTSILTETPSYPQTKKSILLSLEITVLSLQTKIKVVV